MSKHQAPVEINTIEEAKAFVMKMAEDSCADESCLVKPVLGQCVSNAVEARWDGTVSNFVPILAFREVQECIQLGYCPDRSGGMA